MKRRLLNLLTILSLLLCALFAAAWARSSGRYDVARGTLARQGPLPFVELKSEGGALSVGYMPSSSWGAHWTTESGTYPRRWFRYGFLCYSLRFRMNPYDGTPPVMGTYYRVQAPYWALVTVSAVLPAWRGGRVAWLRRKRRLARDGRCVRCGYDLRATPDRCPECGERLTRTAGPLPLGIRAASSVASSQ